MWNMTDERPVADLEMTAAELKKYFNKAKREKHGKPYHPSEKFRRPEFWLAAAENCIQAGADPYSYVRALFLYTTTPGGPYPNQLPSNHAVKCYQQYRRLHGVDDHSQQDMYTQEIKHVIRDCFIRAMQQPRRLRDFLLDDALGLDVIPAFVRVLLLPNDRSVVERWRHEAYLELKPNQKLMDVLVELKYDLSFLSEME